MTWNELHEILHALQLKGYLAGTITADLLMPLFWGEKTNRVRDTRVILNTFNSSESYTEAECPDCVGPISHTEAELGYHCYRCTKRTEKLMREADERDIQIALSKGVS